jgi:hypothetical protein
MSRKQPPKKKRSLLSTALIIPSLIALVFFGCVVIFAGIFIFSIVGTQAVVDVGDEFLTALRDSDYQAAYNLAAPTLQSELRNADALRVRITERRLTPQSWSFNSRSIDNNVGRASGTVTYADGREGTVNLNFINDGNAWKISGFNLQ